ncbi:MAG: TFIIB-type zinc ribbon-containing protein, partial [Candidatus Lutacidiplasmatales archaeon]
MKGHTPSAARSSTVANAPKGPSKASKSNTSDEAPPQDACPECGSSHLTRDDMRGEIVCADCGLVVDASALVSD